MLLLWFARKSWSYLLNLDLELPDVPTLILLPSEVAVVLENFTLLNIVFWNISRRRFTHTSFTSMFVARRTSLSMATVAEDVEDTEVEAVE